MKPHNKQNLNLLNSCIVGGCLIMFSPFVTASENISDIKTELNALKLDYEQRIHALEERLLIAEQQLSEQAKEVQVTSLAPPTESSYASASNKYNPAIGIIIDGEIWSYSNSEHSVTGFALGGESELAAEGISIGESEFIFSANVDDWFYGQITAAIEQEDGEFGIGLEEAYIETLSLPAGMTLRMGRFYSGVGYLNDKHKHTWAFADQALPYRAFLGNQYGDDGVQLRWLAPTDFFLEFGAELFNGSNYPAAGSANDGFGSNAIFARTGGDVGFSHSWTAGVSWLANDFIDRQSGDEDSPISFTGSSDIYIADFVWKWAPNGNSRQRNVVFQAEYLWRDEEGEVTLPINSYETLPLNQKANGWYAQASYQWMPRWRAGVRIDRLSASDSGSAFNGSILDTQNDNPQRYSFMVDYSNSEFSRFRLQFNHDDTGLVSDSQFGLQYIMSIGAHGGHEF